LTSSYSRRQRSSLRFSAAAFSGLSKATAVDAQDRGRLLQPVKLPRHAACAEPDYGAQRPWLSGSSCRLAVHPAVPSDRARRSWPINNFAPYEPRSAAAAWTGDMVAGGAIATPPSCCPAYNKRSAMAERVGFEPTVRLHAQRFSRPSRSTTLAPLRGPAYRGRPLREQYSQMWRFSPRSQ
jgi:hypothetical protein